MKKLAYAVFAFMMVGLLLPRVGNVADVDWFGKFSLLGGAERTTRQTNSGPVGSGNHGLVMTEAVGVIPFTPILGMQFNAGYANMFGHGNKFGMQAGPIFSFGMGKAGLFVTDQFHIYNQGGGRGGIRSANFVWLTPSVSLYDLIPATNIDLWWSHQLSKHNLVDGKFGDGTHQLAPTSTLRAAINFFPPFLFGPGNTELTLGVQVNGISGMDRTRALSGAGPVLGMAVMPWQNLEVQVFKMTIDNRSRYQVTSGVQFFVSREPGSLMQMRRKYLEPTNMPHQISTRFRFGD